MKEVSHGGRGGQRRRSRLHPGASEPVVRAQKPRLAMAKANHKNGLPVCTVAPAVTGTVTVGQVLTCSSGTWLNSPTYTYQWRRAGAGEHSAPRRRRPTPWSPPTRLRSSSARSPRPTAQGVVIAKSNAATVP